MLNQINATIELPVLLMMTALFSACLFKKDKTPRNKNLLVIISVTVCAILCDILFQSMLGEPEKVPVIKILFGACYILAYALVIAFHYFMLADISQKTAVPKLLYYLPLLMATAVSVTYFLSYNNGFFFRINASGEYVNGELNSVNLLIRLALLILDVIITVVYSHKIGLRSTLLLLTYEIFPIISSFIENKYRLSIIYIVVSLLVLIDYISVNVEKDIVLANQRQLMAEQEKKLVIEKTNIMISQIQPHFLYNALSSIMACCTEDPKRAVEALADFSDYLRGNMRSITADRPVPFRTELQHIQTYIRLEKFRFGERLNVEYDIGFDQFFLPALAVQPLVENAVKHGIAQKAEGGTVKIKTEQTRDGVMITVSDDGIGFDMEKYHRNTDPSEHIGISNVRSRLDAMCGGTLTVESVVGQGTTVTVFLPSEQMG